MTPAAITASLTPRKRFTLSGWQFAMLLFVLAFVIRLAVTATLRNLHHFPNPSCCGADAIEFNDLALNLASGRGYTLNNHVTAFRAPGFPALLSLVYRVSYEDYFLAYITFCVVGALTCVATYYLARSLISERAARLSGVLLAIYFPHAYFSSTFLAEALTAFLLTLGPLLLIRFFKSGAVWLLIGAAVAFGYASLTRPFAFLCIPMSAAIIAWHSFRSGKGRVRPLLYFAIASTIVLTPWAYRNYRIYHQVVVFTTNGGSTFYGSNNDVTLHDAAHMGGWVSTTELPHRDWIDRTPDEVSHDRMEWSLGWAWVRSHWRWLPLLVLYKMGRFILPELWSGNRMFVLAQCVTYLPLAALIALGLFRNARTAAFRSPAWLVVHSVIVANLIATVVFYGSARFRDCTASVLVLYAATSVKSSLVEPAKKV